MINLEVSRKELFYLKALLESDIGNLESLVERLPVVDPDQPRFTEMLSLAYGVDHKLKEAIANSS